MRAFVPTGALAILAMVGCRTEQTYGGGTGVGNPGSSSVAVAPATGATLRSATAEVEAVTLSGCDGASELIEVSATMNLLEPDSVAVPQGTWCTVEVHLSGPMEVIGDGDLGGDFHVLVEVEQIDMDSASGVVVDGDDLVLELGWPGWLDARELDLEAGDSLQVAPGDAIHDGLAERVRTASAWFYDHNGDGQVDSDERAAGPAAQGTGSRTPPEETDDDEDDD